jgi:hypothetical protein
MCAQLFLIACSPHLWSQFTERHREFLLVFLIKLVAMPWRTLLPKISYVFSIIFPLKPDGFPTLRSHASQTSPLAEGNLVSDQVKSPPKRM